MRKVCFLSSGGGGNLKFLYFILKSMKSPNFHLSVIADRECGATLFAQNNGIEYKIIEVNKKDQLSLNSTLREFEPDLIFTTIHKMISPPVLDLYGERMVNLHYSLLPHYKGVIGMKGVENAIANRDVLLGVTTHKVVSEIDAGPIVVQSHFQNPNNYELAVRASFRIGCLQIWTILQDQEDSSLVLTDKGPNLIEDLVVHHSRTIAHLPDFVNEVFWSQISIS